MRVLWAFVAAGAIAASCANYQVRSEGSATDQTEDAVVPNDRLYVERAGSIAVVSVATGKIERDLPEGVLSADRTRLYAVQSTGTSSTVRTIDPASGGELARLTLPGKLSLPRSSYGPKGDALSPGGRYLVLESETAGSFAVVDLKNAKEHARVALNGPFTYDAIDEYGMSLYLLEHPQQGTDRYNVRMYDLGLKRLDPTPIVDAKTAQPTAADLARGTMGGIYHASATVGLWHFGLYTNATAGPVVHALNMTARYAFCIRSLSDQKTFKQAWAIVSDPKGGRVLAIDPANGAFASITADQLQVAQRSFKVKAGPDTGVRGSAVISGDGSRLYATGGKGLVVVDTHTLTMKAQYLVDRELSSVMASTDGTRLYVLAPDGAISRIEPGTGRDLGVVARLPSAVAIVRID